MKSLSHVRLFVTPWNVTCSAPSMGFSRQEYWSRLPFPSPRDLPDPGIEPGSPALEAGAGPLVSYESSRTETVMKLVTQLCLGTPWTVACQAPLPMGFSRPEYWRKFPSPFPGELLDTGIKPRSLALQVDSLPTEL